MNFETISPRTNLDPAQVFGNILGFVLWIAAFIGAGLLIYGITQLVQAYQEKTPDAMQKGLILCFSGVALMSVKIILQLIGVV